MATSTISDTVLDPSGTAVADVTVTARLKPWGGFRTDTATMIAREESTTTDASGNWALTLEENDNITPTGTYWEVTVEIPDHPETYAIEVGTNDATLLASLISAPPAISTPTYLTQASADSRYQALSVIGTDSPAAVTATAVAGSSTAAARGDHAHALGASVAGVGLNLTSGVLSVGGFAPVSVTTTVVTITPGYRIPAAQTATPTAVGVLGNDTWTRGGKQFVFSEGVWQQITPEAATVTATSTTSATTFSDPLNAFTGPSVTLNTGSVVLVTVHCKASNPSSSGDFFWMGVAVSGATTLAAADVRALQATHGTANYHLSYSRTFKITGLTPGVNTFTAKYRRTAQNWIFTDRDISVESLPGG